MTNKKSKKDNHDLLEKFNKDNLAIQKQLLEERRLDREERKKFTQIVRQILKSPDN